MSTPGGVDGVDGQGSVKQKRVKVAAACCALVHVQVAQGGPLADEMGMGVGLCHGAGGPASIPRAVPRVGQVSPL